MIKEYLAHHKWDILVVVFLSLFSFAIWWPSHYYPLFWDSTFLVHTAQSILSSNFSNLVTPDPGYAHPTLIGILLALFWKLFGTSVTISHLLMLPFLPILLISTYFFIFKQTNKTLGLLSATLIAFTPVVLAEYVNVYVDLPTAAFVALSLCFWQRKKYLLWSIAYSCAILSKLPALAVAPYFLLQAIYIDKKRVLHTILMPILVLSSWLSYHFVKTGWLLNSPNFKLAVATESFDPIPTFFQITSAIFTGQGRLFLTSISILCLVYLYISIKPSLKSILNPLLYEDLLPILVAITLFVLAGEFGFRYAIFIYIFYASIVSKIAFKLITKFENINAYIYGSLVISLIILTTFWHPVEQTLKVSRFNAPDDLGIIDYIYVFRSITSYAQTHRNENYVYYGAFPENVSLTDPIFGFVDQPIPFHRCEDFQYNPQEKQLLIIHPFSPTQLPCIQLFNSQTVSVLTGSEHNGKWIDVYRVDKN